ncbi:MAG: TolC family protein [Planctomycetales bacterium]|nr:TolC family protein [Planctomycetales bacterium]
MQSDSQTTKCIAAALTVLALVVGCRTAGKQIVFDQEAASDDSGLITQVRYEEADDAPTDDAATTDVDTEQPLHDAELPATDTPAVDDENLDLEVMEFSVDGELDPLSNAEPLTLGGFRDIEYLDLSLQQAMQIALANATVLRDAGGTVVQSSQVPKTILDSAIVASDPRFGVEAALSQFDAMFGSDVTAQNIDRALNNSFFGGGTRTLKQDLLGVHQRLTKRTVSGAEFGIYNEVDFDSSNAPGNQFTSAWTWAIVAEARQPLGRGRGTLVNRIAGPYSQPGVYNGVMIAQLNTNVELKRFEKAIRDLASNVENAYWDLYLAYRNFDAKNTAYRASSDVYDKVAAQANAGRRGAAEAIQAKWQRDFFLNEVEAAITGTRRDGTRTTSNGGMLITTSGLFQAERRLRLLLGLPSSDGRFARPIDEPSVAPIRYSWDESLNEAMTRRVELCEERLHVRKQELEYTAAKQHLLPDIDLVARHRNRGFGRQLFSNDPGQFSNAFDELISGDFDEWEFGLAYSVALGKRAEHAALHKAKLELMRAKFFYKAKQQDIENELQGAFQEMDGAIRRIHRTGGIRDLARSEVDTLAALYQTGQATLDQLLDSQRRLSDSEMLYQRSVVDYALALKDFHYQKGTLLDYESIQLCR